MLKERAIKNYVIKFSGTIVFFWNYLFRSTAFFPSFVKNFKNRGNIKNVSQVFLWYFKKGTKQITNFLIKFSHIHKLVKKVFNNSQFFVKNKGKYKSYHILFSTVG